jgi:hypothetical protein
MAMTMKAEGMEEISRMLNQMEGHAEGVAAGGLYEGAGVMADAINEGAKTIKADKFHYAVFPGATTRLPSQEEKEIVLAAGAGIAKFNKDGTEVDTSVGFSNAGYAELKGKMVPIPKIVNAINSGTSFMAKQPFVRKAVSKATPKAIEQMQRYIEAELEKIGKGYTASMKD